MARYINGQFPHFAQAIGQAESLVQLHRALIKGMSELDSQDRANIDLSQLPTYGGDAPADTHCVWSWDADSLLVGDAGVESWRIVSRQEWEDRP